MSSKEAMLHGISGILTPVLLILIVALFLWLFSYFGEKGYSKEQRSFYAFGISAFAFISIELFLL